MERYSKLVLIIIGAILCRHAYADSHQIEVGIPNTNTSTTHYLGPTLRMSTTSYLTDDTAYSFAGELGVMNLRGSATFGWEIAENQRLKVTAELLSQELTYSFFAGNDDQWVFQGAIGGDYVYDLNSILNAQLDLRTYFSYAPSKSLSTRTATFRQKRVLRTVVDSRRIAGSDAFGLSPGIIIQPFVRTRLSAALNYDNVTYNTHYASVHDDDASGFGGTIRIDQFLSENISLGLQAAIRQPFNDYEVNLDYQNLQYMGRWTIGLFGDYLDGKNPLPNSWNLGVHADYFFDPCVSVPTLHANVKGERDLKGEASSVQVRIPNSFVNWVADPAVRMPQVLAIPDERFKVTCTIGAPMLIATLPDIVSDAGADPFNVATAQAFAGQQLVFSIASVSDSNPADTSTVSINPSTGLIRITPEIGSAATLTIVVRAANDCGSVTTSFTFTFNAT